MQKTKIKMGNSKTKPAEKSDSTETNENSNASTTPSIYPQLQIRNCIRNVRNNSDSFTDMYPNEAGSSCGAYNHFVITITAITEIRCYRVSIEEEEEDEEGNF